MRPVLRLETVRTAGHLQQKLKTWWRDGTSHLVMSPIKFMQRLVALAPGPPLHVISVSWRV